MLRFLAPYFAVAMVAAVIGGVGYGTDRVSVAGVYGIAFAGMIVFMIGAVRWEQRHPPSD
jgi:hypothetical protein